VLCDFIYDKAKRLFSKYDNLVKESKVIGEEKLGYFSKKIEFLETENEDLKLFVGKINEVVKDYMEKFGLMSCRS